MQLEGKRKTLAQTVGVVVFMGALAWASVPLYDWFCRVTGYGGATNVSEENTNDILDQTILVRFDASLERGMPWEFTPVEREMEVRIGETGLAFYEAHNPTDRPIAGTASYNVAPFAAGSFFAKIDCFCFELQVLEPGETVLMPVTFYVDPEIVEDREAKHTNHITLSYTFHVTDMPEDTEEQASLAPVTRTDLN
ncbi:MAG: cytochrome c oxidase assembly protein [Pseudomonadota bacterium]